MRSKKRAFVISAAVILIGTIGAAAVDWQVVYRRSAINLEGASNDKIWNAVVCRARVYLQKAQGGSSEVSWTELWRLTLLRRGFHCREGSSFEASLSYSSSATESDRKAGESIFHQRCAGCHGVGGTGGPVAPSLTRREYTHGDSDFAILQILWHGIPGTAMPKADLPLPELLQVIAYVKSLQAHLAEDQRPKASRLAIQVSSGRLRGAGAKPDEWLTYSGSYNGWRHTSLAQITPANVAQLRVRWVRQFDIADQNIEATPLVIDGVIFMTADAGHVLALSAKTGDKYWEYTRPVPTGLPLEYGLANRGLAIYGSTLFLGSIDGYLVAIDANDGKEIWQ